MYGARQIDTAYESTFRLQSAVLSPRRVFIPRLNLIARVIFTRVPGVRTRGNVFAERAWRNDACISEEAGAGEEGEGSREGGRGAGEWGSRGAVFLSIGTAAPVPLRALSSASVPDPSVSRSPRSVCGAAPGFSPATEPKAPAPVEPAPGPEGYLVHQTFILLCKSSSPSLLRLYGNDRALVSVPRTPASPPHVGASQ